MSYSEREFRQFVTELNRKFKYVKDKEEYGFQDVWTLLEDEKFKGDCEDYALTIWNKFGGTIHFVNYFGSGHAILELPCGKFIDNIQKRRVTRDYLLSHGYRFKFKVYNPVVWMWIKVGSVKKWISNFRK